MINIKSILISAGGTAGHAIPAIEVANELARRNYKVIFITDNRMFDFIKINTRENSSIKVLCFKGRGLYKSKIFKNLKSIFLLCYSSIQSFKTILIILLVDFQQSKVNTDLFLLNFHFSLFRTFLKFKFIFNLF